MPAPGSRVYVDPIVGEPSPHGLLGGCVEVVTTTDVHTLMGTEFTSSSCADANTWIDCPEPGDPPNPASKVFDRPRPCSFAPVTVYAGTECSVVGSTHAENQARAMEALRLGEQRALEAWFMSNGLRTMATGNDLTPGTGALHIVNGIGVLESWLANNYGGQGVLHVPVGTASLLAMHSQINFQTEETCPQTLAGNSVILGAGYAANIGPDGNVAPAGEAWLYMTPPVRVRRDARVQATTAEAQSINTRTNDRRALAETTMVVETSCCFAAAVRVSLSACC